MPIASFVPIVPIVPMVLVVIDARWRLLQLADSGFPAGGFAHSGGLEAAVAHGEVRGADGVAAFAAAALWQAGALALPFAREAHRDTGAAADLDRRCDRAQAGHVTRRASRAQGRAWSRACAESFAAEPAMAALPVLPLGHLPVAFGVSVAALGVGVYDALALYLQLAGRGVLSAAVRLGRLGPHAAQRAQAAMAPVAAAVLAACGGRGVDEVAHVAPIEELFANLHDGLPARMFQS